MHGLAPLVALMLAATARAAPALAVPSVPAPDFEIVGVSSAGSGCPANSVENRVLSDGTTLALSYNILVAQSGPASATADIRKNCQLNVKVRYPGGWQFAVSKATYRGYATLGDGDLGTSKSTYYFSGLSQQATSPLTLRGPYDNNYVKDDQFAVGSTVWSPCGKEGQLNINWEVRVAPIDTKHKASITVESPQLELTWQRC